MRILEETKDYVIYYSSELIDNLPPIMFKTLKEWLDKASCSFYLGFIKDKNTGEELYDYQKDSGDYNKTIMFLGKKLIKKWKKERKK